MTHVIRSLNLEISNNFRKSNIYPRPTKSHGLWCGFLLPTILLLYTWQYETSHTYRITAYMGLGLMIYNLLFIFYIAFDCLLIKEPVYAGCMFSMLISSFLMVLIVGEGVAYAISLTSSFIFLNYCILRYALNAFPHTFTVGEITIVVQGIILFLAMSATKLLLEKTPDEFVNAVLYSVFLGAGGIVASLYSMPYERRDLHSLKSLFSTTAVFLIVMFHLRLGATFALQCVSFMKYPHRWKLLGLWAALAAVAGLVIWARVRRGVKADTANRKIFHFLASLVFASGILVDLEMMRLAAGLGFAVLIVIEALRKSGISPISDFLESAFKIYKDEKDKGAFALTPIYLYVGLACPLLLVPQSASATSSREPALLAGVLAAGVGDAAASCLGSRLGRYKWPKSQKTVEGTVFNILAQMMTITALVSMNLLTCSNALARGLVAALATALVEARTEQVDNLVLPLLAVGAFQLTWLW